MNDVLEVDADPRAVELGDHHVAAQNDDHEVLGDNDRLGQDGHDNSQTAAGAGPSQAGAVGTSGAPKSDAALVTNETTHEAGEPAMSSGRESNDGGADRDRAAGDSCAL